MVFFNQSGLQKQNPQLIAKGKQMIVSWILELARSRAGNCIF